MAIVQQWATAANATAVNLVYSHLPPIEEGPALEMDTAQYQAYVAAVVHLSPFTLSDITTVVPQDGSYPTSFLAETTVRSGSTASKYLLAFAKDSADAPWKLAAYLTPASGAGFPSFALNGQGYGTALDAATLPGYPHSAPALVGAFCNYLGTTFGGPKQVPSAPTVSFAPGPFTSTAVSSGAASIKAFRQAGGTSDGTYAAETYVWAYKLADGSAFAIVTVQSTLDQMAGPNTQFSAPAVYPFITAGRYSSVTQASEGTFGIVEPASGAAPSVVMQYVQFTKAFAS